MRHLPRYKYHTIDALHADQRSLIQSKYDDWNLVTGRVGRGKSKWIRKNFRRLCPHQARTIQDVLNHTHFNQDDFWEDYLTLKPGDGIILDEFDGHRRAAMRGERITFLERMKRTRSRRVHVFIGYDRIGNIDRELITDRNAFWHHTEERGLMVVRQPITKVKFKYSGEPIEPTKHPIVAEFPWSGWEPAGWEKAYEDKKDREMNLYGQVNQADVEDPWMKEDPRLMEIIRRRLTPAP